MLFLPYVFTYTAWEMAVTTYDQRSILKNAIRRGSFYYKNCSFLSRYLNSISWLSPFNINREIITGTACQREAGARQNQQNCCYHSSFLLKGVLDVFFKEIFPWKGPLGKVGRLRGVLFERPIYSDIEYTATCFKIVYFDLGFLNGAQNSQQINTTISLSTNFLR
jgi:hypothetical protein